MDAHQSGSFSFLSYIGSIGRLYSLLLRDTTFSDPLCDLYSFWKGYSFLEVFGSFLFILLYGVGHDLVMKICAIVFLRFKQSIRILP